MGMRIFQDGGCVFVGFGLVYSGIVRLNGEDSAPLLLCYFVIVDILGNFLS